MKKTERVLERRFREYEIKRANSVHGVNVASGSSYASSKQESTEQGMDPDGNHSVEMAMDQESVIVTTNHEDVSGSGDGNTESKDIDGRNNMDNHRESEKRKSNIEVKKIEVNGGSGSDTDDDHHREYHRHQTPMSTAL